MSNLPFLKGRKTPRIAPPLEEKLVKGSSDELLNHHLISELLDAYEAKDVKLFKQALESLVLQMFDFDKDNEQ